MVTLGRIDLGSRLAGQSIRFCESFFSKLLSDGTVVPSYVELATEVALLLSNTNLVTVVF